MSLAYGVEGELQLILENNFGDYYNWSEIDVLDHINTALRNMLEYADDPKDRKKINLIRSNEAKKKKIAKEFIKEKKEEGSMKK